MDELTVRGMWWLPSDPESTVAGTLTFTPTDGPVLELLGSLSDKNDRNFGASFEPQFVNGMSTDGKPITLYGCAETRRSYNTGSGFHTTRLIASVLLMGHHFIDESELSFRRFAVEYDQFSNWAWVSGFKLTMEQNPETKRISRHEVSYEFPDRNEVVVNDMRVRLSPTFHQNAGSISKYTLEQKMFWEVRPPSTKTFDEFTEIFYHLRNFLTLGVGRPVYPVRIRATLSIETPEGTTLERAHQVEVYYTTRDEVQPERLVHPAHMLFTLPNIRPHYEQALTHWFAKAGDLRPVYDLYFSTLYNPRLYVEGRFLSLAQALETYHRRMAGGTYVDDAKYTEISAALARVLDGFELNSSTADAFRGKLRFLNEVSLRSRIKSIVESLGAIAEPFIQNPGKFATRVVDTRNYLTHYNPSLKTNAAEGEELFFLSELLRFLVEACLLLELGLPEELRAKLMSEHQGYRYLRK